MNLLRPVRLILRNTENKTFFNLIYTIMKTDNSTQEFDFQGKALSGLIMLLVQVVLLPVIGALPFLFFEENVAWGCFVPG